MSVAGARKEKKRKKYRLKATELVGKAYQLHNQRAGGRALHGHHVLLLAHHAHVHLLLHPLLRHLLLRQLALLSLRRLHLARKRLRRMLVGVWRLLRERLVLGHGRGMCALGLGRCRG